MENRKNAVPEDTIDLVELCREALKRWYLFVILVVVATGAAAAVCWGVLEDEYTATVNMYIITKSENTSNGESSATSATMNLSSSIATDVSSLVKIESVRNDTARSCGITSLSDYTITATEGTSERVMTLSVEGKNPEMCAKIANTMTKEVQQVAMDNMNLEAINVLKEATTPTSPSGPPRVRYTLMAALGGFVVAFAIVAIMYLAKPTFRKSEEIEKELGVPVLCRAPLFGEGEK